MEELGGVQVTVGEIDISNGETKERDDTMEEALLTQPPELGDVAPQDQEDEEEEEPLLTQLPLMAGVVLEEVVTALRGVMNNAINNAATAILLVGEMSADFEEGELGTWM